MKKWGVRAVPAVLLIGASAFLLKGDVWIFWTWWLLAGIMGLMGMPVTGRLFEGFEDKGWLFSKVLSVAAAGFFTWLLVSVRLLKFTTGTCILVTAACGIGCFWLFRQQTKKGIECFPAGQVTLVYWEEVLFFGMFLLWTYLAGFHPEAYGTEKFMDYGFMEVMMRSRELPAKDIWYSQGHINYYYGGQYFAVFLTKLSGSTAAMTYNLMRTFVAGLAFVLPFSLVYQMTADKLQGKLVGRKRRVLPAVSGITAGVAVSIAGNMHYVVYGVIQPLIQKLQGMEVIDSYWFPDATRYIGFDPDVADKTIHEFPCYSFVLGDLHAHVVNIMFVLLLTGLLYAWNKKMRSEKQGGQNPESMLPKTGRNFWKRQLLMPHILLGSVLLGMFQWTNFWDFVIYFVVTGAVVLFTNIICLEGKAKKILAVTALQAAEVLGISYVVILPFTLQFETMVQGVALAQNHSLPHQLFILWGLPVILTAAFLITVLWEKCQSMETKSLYRFMEAVDIPDLFAVIMGLCAIGLVAIPELVYVRDIYENGNARANTMFKLTYQAYILFGMTMGYVIFRLGAATRQKLSKAVAGVAFILLICTCGYFGNSVKSWFGNVLSPSEYKGQNAVSYLETDFPEDAAGIRWLRENVEGVEIVLEANGDSYTGFERVSAMTGLPTVLGWYVHEWLWRNDVGDLNQKSADVESIYTTDDRERAVQLIEKYDISYIFVGARESEKYEDRLNDALLQSLGEVVFGDETSGTYIVKVS